MKYLNRLVNFLKFKLWQAIELRRLKRQNALLEQIKNNPEKLKIETEETSACTHEKLTAISGSVYQCQNKKCYRVFEILMDKSYKPNDFVKEYEAIKEQLKGIKE